jgi:hypothetical protein
MHYVERIESNYMDWLMGISAGADAV